MAAELHGRVQYADLKLPIAHAKLRTKFGQFIDYIELYSFDLQPIFLGRSINIYYHIELSVLVSETVLLLKFS
jgi:hypothetical protein